MVGREQSIDQTTRPPTNVFQEDQITKQKKIELNMSLLNGFLGGSLIGGAAGLTLLGAGEIMGFSGIIGTVLQNPFKAAQDPSQQWKLTFLSTFLLSAYAFFLPVADGDKISSVASITSPLCYALSGLLVGLGTKLGNGCTSGHGICGMARLSKRSISAILTFMGAAVATTVVTKKPAFDFLRTGAAETYVPSWIMASVAATCVGFTLYGAWKSSRNEEKKESSSDATESTSLINGTSSETCENNESTMNKRLPAAVGGITAAAGLSLSTMVYPAAVRGFLDVTTIPDGTWDPTLMFVMMGGLLVSFVTYQFVPGHSVVPSCPKLDKPLADKKFGIPTNQAIDAPLLGGAVLFGTGWGLTGLCPGPALLLTMTGLSGMVLQWWPAFFIGQRAGQFIKDHFL